jgi:hypothetical protein
VDDELADTCADCCAVPNPVFINHDSSSVYGEVVSYNDESFFADSDCCNEAADEAADDSSSTGG